jgi:hypothetical protein
MYGLDWPGRRIELLHIPQTAQAIGIIAVGLRPKLQQSPWILKYASAPSTT